MVSEEVQPMFASLPKKHSASEVSEAMENIPEEGHPLLGNLSETNSVSERSEEMQDFPQEEEMQYYTQEAEMQDFPQEEEMQYIPQEEEMQYILPEEEMQYIPQEEEMQYIPPEEELQLIPQGAHSLSSNSSHKYSVADISNVIQHTPQRVPSMSPILLETNNADKMTEEIQQPPKPIHPMFASLPKKIASHKGF